MYSVAGEAAAHVAGTSYEQLVMDKVIRPLGLNKTGLSPNNMKRLHPDNYALPHEALSYEAGAKGDFKVLPLDEIYMTMAPSGDAYSNVVDLVRWGKTVMDLGKVDGGKQVLNDTSIVETLKAYTFFNRSQRGPEYAPAMTYGLGWIQDSYQGHNFYRHDGWVSGFTANLIMFPYDDLVIASTSNIAKVTQIGEYLPIRIAEGLLDIPVSSTFDWVEELAVPEVRDFYTAWDQYSKGLIPPQVPNKPATFANNLHAYAGEYYDPLFGTFSVAVETTKDDKTGKTKEVLMYRYNGITSMLKHHHYDAFVVTLDDPVLLFKALITFSSDPVSKGGDKGKKRPISRLQIQEIHAAAGIQKRIFKKRH
ncbi:hypothetical protein BGZ96_005017 [Linnemannia gamsii]|uniref:Beta-lactamase-related domain-containing protein n=1 Tax=Linnemannia gamsii TaxID=64522 RepID=A0ABQ7JHM2_9FUNG|nr:hypothetical protein BGZ96_005017 [Linnemannia gamsii]